MTRKYFIAIKYTYINHTIARNAVASEIVLCCFVFGNLHSNSKSCWTRPSSRPPSSADTICAWCAIRQRKYNANMEHALEGFSIKYVALYCIVLYCIVLYCIVLPFIRNYLIHNSAFYFSLGWILQRHQSAKKHHAGHFDFVSFQISQLSELIIVTTTIHVCSHLALWQRPRHRLRLLDQRPKMQLQDAH